MKYRIYICWLVFCVLISQKVAALSIVYNFRIAQITKQSLVEETGRHNTLVSLLFSQFRERHDRSRLNYVGTFGSYIYGFDSYYCRADFAVAGFEERRNHRTTFSDIETDDILFTVGRNFRIDKQRNITFSALFGIPTHKIFRLQHPEFGHGQIGTGLQLDGFYGLKPSSGFLYGLRYLSFVPREALDKTGGKHLVTLGNVGDVLVAYRHNWQQYGIEFGYTHRSRFGETISPPLDDKGKPANAQRSNFYLVGKYKFMRENVEHRLLCNISYGFDHRPALHGNKYVVGFWTSWNISF